MQTASFWWNPEEIVSHEPTLNMYNPLRTGSYIPLCGRLKNNYFAVNAQYKDDKCFYYFTFAKYVNINKCEHRQYKKEKSPVTRPATKTCFMYRSSNE